MLSLVYQTCRKMWWYMSGGSQSLFLRATGFLHSFLTV